MPGPCVGAGAPSSGAGPGGPVEEAWGWAQGPGSSLAPGSAEGPSSGQRRQGSARGGAQPLRKEQDREPRFL